MREIKTHYFKRLWYEWIERNMVEVVDNELLLRRDLLS